mmetsp:Transcript_12380/g.37765  ORF Transcript_12380/g.37765 Transcript_12380/m.37765 type:complete len:254 (+) Transcript_12380:488-1249(+)
MQLQDDVRTATMLLLGLKSYGRLEKTEAEEECFSGSAATETGSEGRLLSKLGDENLLEDDSVNQEELGDEKKRPNERAPSIKKKRQKKVSDAQRGEKHAKSKSKSRDDRSQSLQPNTNVACQVRDESSGDAQWILGKVVQYFPDSKRYQVLDVGDSEEAEIDENAVANPKFYKLARNKIRVLPEVPNVDLAAQARILAVYPNTTVFYPATVKTCARTRSDLSYLLEFDDEEEEEGNTRCKAVPARHVLPLEQV